MPTESGARLRSMWTGAVLAWVGATYARYEHSFGGLGRCDTNARWLVRGRCENPSFDGTPHIPVSSQILIWCSVT